jgi:peptidoglycan/LPS O-acetylase OafA/YrhL
MYRPLPSQLPALDGLRGLAALIVLVSHCANEGWLPAFLGSGMGQIGVAVFYVLSGFLMLHFAIDRPFDQFSLQRYAVARFSRVVPLYILALLITSALYLALGTGVSFYGVDEANDLLRSWFLLRGVGVLWSIPVELHFYALFPLLWWAHRAGRFLMASLALLAACAILAAFQPDPKPNGYLPYWLHFFVIGALVRWLCDDGVRNRIDPLRTGPALRAAAWACFALLVLLPPAIRIELGAPDFPNRLDPMAIAIVPLVLWFAIAAVGPFRLWASPALRWLGAISYGLYLVHSPVISMVKYLSVDRAIGPHLAVLLVLGVSTLLAVLSLQVFERPVQNALRRQFASPSIAAQA